MKKKKGKSLCISSVKGGVGKTITALNLAGCGKVLNKKVLIIDFDLTAGGVALALDVSGNENIYTLVNDLQTNKYQAFKNYVLKYDDNIDVLASPKDPRLANKVSNKYIGAIIEKAVIHYDLVIIDTSHVMDEVNIILKDNIDMVLQIITNDPIDVKSMRTLVNIYKDINYTKYKVLLNNSRDPFKNYFSMYDLKNIIGTRVNYTLSYESFLQDIDKYIMNGEIPLLNPKYSKTFIKDYTSLVNVVADALKEGIDNRED